METYANIECNYNNNLLTLIIIFKSVIKEKLRGMDRHILKTIIVINTNIVILLININIFIVDSDKLKLNQIIC